jgi:O-antigen/teichoic acid export membrane protein
MSLLRNSIANFLGGVMPALVLLVTIPMMVSGLGLTNYGLLTLVGAITGYFSIIDINLTAGSVKYVSEYRALGDSQRESQTIILGLGFYLVLGVIGAGALFVFAVPLASGVFGIPPSQRMVAVSAIQLAALGFLIGQVQQYLNSLPQAIQRYDVTAKLESVFGILVPVVSVITLQFGAGLLEMIEIRIVGSALHAVALGWGCRRLFPELRWAMPTREVMARVMSFSGYAYLSKLASLTYAHADKLIIGGLLGMEAVTIYTVPATLINRFLGLTFRLSSVVFPAASQMAAVGEWDKLQTVYIASTRYITFLNAAIVALALLFGHELLHYWIGGVVAEQGWLVFVLIGLSMFAESLTNLPSLVNDGLGHARISGLFAISRAILGLVLTWTLAKTAGIAGVAAGHLIVSVLLGGAFIIYVHQRTIPFSGRAYLRHGLGTSLLLVGIPANLVWALRPEGMLSLAYTLLGSAACAAMFALIGWRVLLDSGDRADVLRKLRLIPVGAGRGHS